MRVGYFAKLAGISVVAGLLLSTSATADVIRNCDFSKNKTGDQILVYVSQKSSGQVVRYKCRTSSKPRQVKRRRLVRIPVMLGVYR